MLGQTFNAAVWSEPGRAARCHPNMKAFMNMAANDGSQSHLRGRVMFKHDTGGGLEGGLDNEMNGLVGLLRNAPTAFRIISAVHICTYWLLLFVRLVFF